MLHETDRDWTAILSDINRDTIFQFYDKKSIFYNLMDSRGNYKLCKSRYSIFDVAIRACMHENDRRVACMRAQLGFRTWHARARFEGEEKKREHSCSG